MARSRAPLLSCWPNAVVQPMHNQAMPLVLMAAEQGVESDSVEAALAMQSPPLRRVLVMGPR